MKLLNSLYLTDRVFYVLGAIILCFFASFFILSLFYFALGLLVLLVVLLLIDFFILYSKKSIVEVTRTVAAILSLSDENKVVIHLKNKSLLTLKLKIIDELPYQLTERDFNIVTTLHKKESDTINYQLKPFIRGEYAFGDVHVMISSALFLIRKKETTNAKFNTAVYPSILQMKQQELIALNHPSFTQGDNKRKKVGKSYEFDQIKAYVQGDDPRNINWKATSTINELMTNHFEDERSQQIYSIIDKSRIMKMPFNGLTLVDYAINTSLALSNIILKKQDNAGLITFSDGVDTFLKADKSSTQLKKILHTLYKENYDYSEANYELLYANIRRKIPNRSLLFLYTNFDSFYALERVIPVLRMINKYHLLIVLFFENTELEEYAKKEAKTVLDIYQQTIANKFILEKNQIIKELKKHGIQAIKCKPQELSINTINKYLELKSIGII
ncbi:MAG: DUF58 domain-containing protein [Flavobacteriales bacterium CG_4_10_14_0_2_um_filter_32_8]|nr:MAG: DUF58 domain-containing protein [Flavobacteriales bacterium CG_4_10_14_0_2_um_filter_32_8]PJB14740.1 MAG: DUF58 domain-containing protein [Flavobacteriales bacterium CG_4_9_14_3_um_filter_32_8]